MSNVILDDVALYCYRFNITVGLLAALAFSIVFAARHLGQPAQAPKTSLTILEQRYARGEISREQFEEMKQD